MTTVSPVRECSDATVHRTLKRWEEKQIFDKVWALLIYHCEDLSAVDFEWQSADGTLNKARFIGKKGAKAQRIPRPHKPRKAKVSEPIPVTVESRKSVMPISLQWASKGASLSKEMAIHLLAVSQERI